MVVESLLFCLREGAPREGLSYIDFLSTSGIPFSAFGTALLQGPTHFGLSLFRFHTASRIHPPPSVRPFSKGLLASDYLTFAFAPLRGSILRLRRAPSLRGYPLRTISLSLSYRYDGLVSSNRKRSWMMFSMYCPTFLRLCSMSRFEKRMTRMSYFSMRLLRFSSYFIPSKERCCAPSTSMTSRAFLQKKSTM